MTAIHLFKNHPNKDNIKFVVLPSVTEVLKNNNDIAIDCHQLMKKFATGQAVNEGIKFDFTKFFMYENPSLWQIYQLCDFEK